VIRKFFLHVSRDEQKKRFLERIEQPEKNWKFSAADVRERGHWDAYMDAYQKMIRETASEEAPWYVVPADNKWFTRLVGGRGGRRRRWPRSTSAIPSWTRSSTPTLKSPARRCSQRNAEAFRKSAADAVHGRGAPRHASRTPLRLPLPLNGTSLDMPR
jgi:hypothetical protein